MAVEQVGTKKIQGFPKQLIVNANQNRVNGSKVK